MNNEALFGIWHKMCRIRHFDEQVKIAVEDGRIKCFVYLSAGQEAIAASIAEAFRGYKPAIFCQHRSHAAYIAFGGDVVKLRNELLSGKLGDPMIHDPNINLFGHSGLVGDQVPIAVGYAFASGTPVVCFLGDSTVEEDAFWPSVGFAATHNLPVLFVCEDNGLSVVTEIEKRRIWNAVNIAKAHGLKVWDDSDNPRQVYYAAKDFLRKLETYFASFDCCRKYHHVGIGSDGDMEYDRMSLFRQQLTELNSARTARIDSDAAMEMADLWKR